MDISVEMRRDKILEFLHTNGKVKVTELSQIFGVSEVTTRIDLADLEAKGLLSRIHGGAVSSYKTYYGMNFQQRVTTNEAEKREIAEHICEMVEDDDTLMLNAGTTTLFVMRTLVSMKKKLNIVTNSIAIASDLAGYPDMNVTLLGGVVNLTYQFTYGDDAINQLSSYHADKLILSVDGVSVDSGVTTYYQQEAEVCRQMIRQSGSVIVAADYTKIGRTAFVKVAPFEEIDIIITNKKAPKSELELLELNECNTILA